MPDLTAVPFAHDAADTLCCGTAVICYTAGIIGIGEGAGAGEAGVAAGIDTAHNAACAIVHGGGAAAAADRGLVQHVHDDDVQHIAGNVICFADPADNTAHAALALYSAAVLAQAYLRVVCQQTYNAAHALNAIDCAFVAVGAVADHCVFTCYTYDATRVIDILLAAHRAVVVAAVHDGALCCSSHDAAGYSAVVHTGVADIH